MSNTEHRCFHCGEAIPPGVELTVTRNGENQSVCCAGCQAVAGLIEASGLGRYYQFRQSLALKAEQDVGEVVDAWKGCDERESMWGTDLCNGNRELLLQTEGIRCAACSWLIRTHLEADRGVSAVQVDTATGYTRIVWNPEATRLSNLARSLLELGYKPHLPLASEEEHARQNERREALKRLGVAGLGMMQVMMYAVGLYAGDASGMSDAARAFLEWVSLAVTLPVMLYSGRVFFEGAWRSLKARSPGMDVPVALAIGLAFLASCFNFFRGEGQVWFDSVVMFIFFLSLGRYLEMVLRHRNLQAGAALARLLPEWAERIRNGQSETVPATDLESGDMVRVRTGETFPADGEITVGETEVDEALLTGESRPLLRRPGDAVIAGTINMSQPVEIEVTAGGQETTVSALGRLLLLAQAKRPDSFDIPAWLVPAFIIIVLMLAVGSWAFWQMVDPSRAFPAMLAVLVASCPCALSLAVPAVYAAASRRLLDEGVLMTRGDCLPALNRVDTVVFDKTGTLTRGIPKIQAVHLNPQRSEFSREQVTQIAAAIEASSAHPLSRAFAEVEINSPAKAYRSVAGQGMEAEVEGRLWRIGQAGFVDNNMTGPQPDGIWLGDESGWLARFELGDALREGATGMIADLNAAGLAVLILSGDSEEAVGKIAGVLEIENWRARQTPEMKLQVLDDLRVQGHTVLMVGDGVNDAPVLAAADVSMTVKGGAELANSAADLILTSDSLGLVTRVREISIRTRDLIRQNLAWAILYNISVVPLAMSGILKPWMAALGMSLSSLVVVANAVRLVRNKERPGTKAHKTDLESISA
jgi:Cu2+-exporting ATPase